MSSGFVPGGTADAPIERSDEWLAAQEELEATRRRKAEELRQSNGRSLYETLEANKVAKQEAFEEANRLKNQFRALDEDEVEFLDSVLESTRREEERVRRETAEGLLTFRQRQEEADKKLLQSQRGDAASPVDEVEEEWAAGAGARKRKRKVEREGLRGVRLRRSSTATSENAAGSVETSRLGAVESVTPQKSVTGSPARGKQVGAVSKPDQEPEVKSTVSPRSQIKPPAAPPMKAGLGLVDYGSDSDD